MTDSILKSMEDAGMPFGFWPAMPDEMTNPLAIEAAGYEWHLRGKGFEYIPSVTYEVVFNEDEPWVVAQIYVAYGEPYDFSVYYNDKAVIHTSQQFGGYTFDAVARLIIETMQSMPVFKEYMK